MAVPLLWRLSRCRAGWLAECRQALSTAVLEASADAERSDAPSSPPLAEPRLPVEPPRSREQTDFASEATSTRGRPQPTRSRRVASAINAAVWRGDTAAVSRLFLEWSSSTDARAPQSHGAADGDGHLSRSQRLDRAQVMDAMLFAAARTADVTLALKLLESMRAEGLPVGYVAHGCVVQALAAAGEFGRALGYLTHSVPPAELRATMYNNLLNACLKAGNTTVAHDAAGHMEAAGVRPDTLTWGLRLNLAGQAGDAAALRALWSSVASDAALLEQPPLHAARVAGLAKLRDGAAALAAFEDMLGRFAPDAAAAQRHAAHLVRAANAVLCLDDGGGDIEAQRHAAAALAALRQAGLLPDRYSAAAMQRALLRSGAPPAAVAEPLAAARDAGAPLDAHAFLPLLRAYGAAGDLAAAQAVWRDMRGAGVQAGVHAHNALIQAHAKAGDFRGADGAYQAMLGAGVAPDRYTYGTLFGAVRHWGLESAAARVRTQGRTRKMDAVQRGFSRIEAAAALQRWVEDMQARRVAHSGPSLVALLAAYGWAGMSGEVAPTLRSALHQGAAPPDLDETRVYTAAITALARAPNGTQMPAALSLYREMRSAGLTPGAHVFAALLGACAYSSGGARVAEQVWEQMREAKVVPNVWVYNAAIKADAFQGQIGSALARVDEMLREGVAPDDVTWGTLAEAAGRIDHEAQAAVARKMDAVTALTRAEVE